MSEDHFSTTLAYSKSPRVSKRTTFQDELQAAISARTAKYNSEYMNNYSDDFEDDADDDDIFKELLKSKKTKSERSKIGKKKHKINDFKLSDDEEENVRPKRVSFLKTRRKSFPTKEEDSDIEVKNGAEVKREEECGHPESSPSLQTETTCQESKTLVPTERSHRESTLSQPSGMTANLSRENEEKPTPQLRESNLKHTPSSGILDDEIPKPRPRQRSHRGSSNTEEDSVGGSEKSPSRPPTSSVSIPLSAEMTSRASSSEGKQNSRSSSPQKPETYHSISSRFSRCPSSTGDGQLSDKSRQGSFTREWNRIEDNNEEDVQKLFAPTKQKECRPEESVKSAELSRGKEVTRRHASFHRPSLRKGEAEDEPNGDMDGASPADEKPSDNRSLSSCSQSKKQQNLCSYTTESRYLGTLKVLDQCTSQKEIHTEAADSLRAIIYQDWLKKKKQILQATLKTKKLEEKHKEEKKKEEELNKKEEAKTSFQAWKEKKTEDIKAKVKTKQEEDMKKQKENEEKVERKEIAKKVFEKWKEEKDEHLKEKFMKQKQAEKKLKQKQEEEKEERKRDCNATFSKWNETKKEVILKKLKKERQQEKVQKEEEKYEKEEKEKMALEMYEKWLEKKERQEKRERKQRKVRAVLQDEPPPPWSPPNKTIPFGK
nr:PREDICTED: microtubule-associated protein 9 [Lepisosteus oculatus]